MIDFNGKELNALRRRRIETTNVVEEVKPKKKPKPKCKWTVIGSGPSGANLTAKDLDGHVACMSTSLERVPLECVTHYLYLDGRMAKMFPDLIRRGIQIVSFLPRQHHPYYVGQPAKEAFRTHPFIKQGKWDEAERRGAPTWIRKVEWLEATSYLEWDKEWDARKTVGTFNPFKWRIGTYTKLRDPIGPNCLQYALNNGATEVHIRGMEGGERESDGSMARLWQVCADYHQVAGQACVDACPDVKFYQYGDPMFLLTGQNVKHKLSKVRPTTNTDIGEPEPEA